MVIIQGVRGITGYINIAMGDEMVQNKQNIVIQHGFYNQSFLRKNVEAFVFL